MPQVLYATPHDCFVAAFHADACDNGNCSATVALFIHASL
jgi:hypothetical protein